MAGVAIFLLACGSTPSGSSGSIGSPDSGSEPSDAGQVAPPPPEIDAGTRPIVDAGTPPPPPPPPIVDAGTPDAGPPADAGTASNDCEGISAPEGSIEEWIGHWDAVSGESGLPDSSGDGTIAAMMSDILHPSWTLIRNGSTSGTFGLWEGSLFPQPAGFVGWIYNSQNIYSGAHVSDSGNSATPGPSNQLYGTDQWEAADPSGGMIAAGQFHIDLRTDTRRVLSFDTNGVVRYVSDLASDAPIIGLGVDKLGHALVIQDGSAMCGGCVIAQWIDSGGLAGSTFFLANDFTAGASTWIETAPLIGAGLAVRRRDYDPANAGTTKVIASQWMATLDSLSTTPRSASWMPANTNLAVIYGGTAYAFLPNGVHDGGCNFSYSLYSPSGAHCGNVASPVFSDSGICGDTYDLVVGEDGSLLYRLPPYLEISTAAGHDTTYTLKYMPAALR